MNNIPLTVVSQYRYYTHKKIQTKFRLILLIITKINCLSNHRPRGHVQLNKRKINKNFKFI